MIDHPFFDTFNAKHKTDQEIGVTFVPPSGALSRLVTRDHVILSGPRGSGKTTLLKMLTHSTFRYWNGVEADEFREKIDFVSIFVAADRSWHGQLKTLPQTVPSADTAILLGMSAFTSHIFKAIISAFIDWNELPSPDNRTTATLLPKLDTKKESDVCSHLAQIWMLAPRASTFLEMQKALSERLSHIGMLRNQLKFGNDALTSAENRFLFVDYREGMKAAAEIHNFVSGLPERRWSFLFDEMEVAPSFIQESLFSDLRGEANRPKINYKLALAPFNKNFRPVLDEHGAASRHDYQHVDLTFARKENGYNFTRQLCELMIRRAGLDVSVEKLLGTSYFSFFDEDSPSASSGLSKYSDDRPLGKIYSRLADKDAGFRQYLTDRKLDLGNIDKLDEDVRAKTLRKIRNIVVMREYFSRPSSSSINAENLSSRSRKTFTLYTGNPTMLALTEGNPRSIIGLFSSIVAEYTASAGKVKVSERIQAEEIQRSIRIMRSLLKTVPHGDSRYQGKGILSFLDDIGAALYNGVMSVDFPDNPPLSFRVNPGVNPHHLAAIGKALNLGALVYVPDMDSEDIISSVIGKRFRLNYLLAVYYKLPISLDRDITLESLLGRRLSARQPQMEFHNDD